MARILVVDDERDLLRVLDLSLRQAGYEVLTAMSGTDGLRLARERRPNLIVLDVMLPDLSGTDVCKRLRNDPLTRTVAIMMLTARGDEIDRVVGFEVGADDYVVKPFSVRELMLRVRALLRRTGSEPLVLPAVEFGCLRIDPEAHRVWVAGDEVVLTPLELKLLVVLYERRNRVQTRATLLQDVWGVGARDASRTVDTHIKRLREKLGRAGWYLSTVRGVGYRFVDTPEEVE